MEPRSGVAEHTVNPRVRHMTREPVVLVGVDGSKASLLAVDWAVAEAKRLGWRVHIVCIYSLPSFSGATLDGGYLALDDTQIQAGARRVVDEAVARVGTGVVVTSAVETGDSTGVLIELSRQAGLIVIGKEGGTAFADRLLGAVSTSLAPHAHCPTVMVPVHGEAKPLRLPVKRIVVGVDGSTSAKVALKRAIQEAEVWDAELTAVAAVPIAQGAGAMAWLPGNIDRDALLADVREGLNVAVDQALGDSEVRVRRHALDGSPAALLTEFSTAVDLLVVGTRGRGGFAGLLLGSTSQTVIAHSDCPVMVVPAKLEEEGAFPTRFPWQQ